MFKNKKASLQISINAIVILILAITVLGIGLAFIRGMVNPPKREPVLFAIEEFTEEIKGIDSSFVEQEKLAISDRCQEKGFDGVSGWDDSEFPIYTFTCVKKLK